MEGVVLCWSEVLEDYIAFQCDDVDPTKIPSGFVPYSIAELWHLFGPNKPDLSDATIRKLHQAKITDAIIVDSYPGGEETSE